MVEKKDTEMNVYEKLLEVQTRLVVGKTKYNDFANFNYRSADDILEAIKPIISEVKASVILTDSIEEYGGLRYIKATAKFIDTKTGESIETYGYAREITDKKKMDDAQMTGSTSSYARKYALNGLLILDDNKDPDSMEHDDNTATNKPTNKPTQKTTNTSNTTKSNGGKISDAQRKRMYAIAKGNNDVAKAVLAKYGYESSNDVLYKDYDKICGEIEAQVNGN